ncbi:MAG: hypothetical protein HN578_14525, partial [Rhodospirillales bacterium]|nr:hypothetical protein [Rhodospirillales bacterium]
MEFDDLNAKNGISSEAQSGNSSEGSEDLGPTQLAPAQLAQAAEPIGKVEELSGAVTATRADGSQDTLSKGDSIYQGDKIETGDGAAVGLVFVDDTTFALGEGGSMVMDEMVYDPATKEGKFSASVAEGVFSFVSGQISKSAVDAMSIETPVVIIGIRGTTGAGRAGPEGSPNTVSLLPDASGNTGEMTIGNQGGGPPVVLSTPGATS